MDRITRKELKQDKFALEVGHSVDFITEHRRELIRYGAVAAAVVLILVAFFTWRRHQAAAREEALAAAIDIQQTPPGAPVGDSGRVFATEQEKKKALVTAFSDVAAKYPGSDEGTIAEYYLGTMAAEDGNTKAAEQWLKDVADSGRANYSSLAKLALAQVYKSEGRLADGEKLIRSVMDKPTDFVSRDEATIALARLLASSNPKEARKLLEPLRTSRPAISRVAMAELSTLPQ